MSDSNWCLHCMTLGALATSMFLPFTSYAQSDVSANDSVPSSGYDMLEEVVITADKPMITAQDGKINYNIDEDPSAAGATMMEMLRKVPLVTVDGNDNIKVNGQSDFKIMINGKEEPSLSANAKMIFKAMPASAATKIEVITEPGAKYDAEGCSAILNIVTERSQKQEGYNANISLDFSKQVESISGFGRMKYGKFIGSVNASYAHSLFPQKSEATASTIFFDNDKATHKSLSFTKQSQKFNFINAGFNLSYEPDKRIFLQPISISTRYLPTLHSKRNLHGQTFSQIINCSTEGI